MINNSCIILFLRVQHQLTNVFSSYGDWPAQLCHKLLGIQSDLDDIVEQSEERSERERSHEQGDEPKLDDWERKEINNHETCYSHKPNCSMTPTHTYICTRICSNICTHMKSLTCSYSWKCIWMYPEHQTCIISKFRPLKTEIFSIFC